MRLNNSNDDIYCVKALGLQFVNISVYLPLCIPNAKDLSLSVFEKKKHYESEWCLLKS